METNPIREAFFAKYGEECLDDQALADFTAGWHAGRANLLSPFSWLSTLEKADADKARIAELVAEVQALRAMFAVSYAGAMLYTDNGELQDNRELPHIDFLRDALSTIVKKLRERAARAAGGDFNRND